MSQGADAIRIEDHKIVAPDLAAASAKVREYVAHLPSVKCVIKKVVLSDGRRTIRGIGATVDKARKDAQNKARSLGSNARILGEKVLNDPCNASETVTVFAETPQQAQESIQQRYGTRVTLEQIYLQSDGKRHSFLFWSWSDPNVYATSIATRATIECQCSCDSAILLRVGPRPSDPKRTGQAALSSSRDANNQEMLEFFGKMFPGAAVVGYTEEAPADLPDFPELDPYAKRIAAMVTNTDPWESAGLYAREGEIQRIGREVNSKHGFQGMQYVWKTVKHLKGPGTTSELTRIWDGIGKWQS